MNSNDHSKERRPRGTLIISSMGVFLSPVKYRLSRIEGDSQPLRKEINACCGASAVQAYLSGRDDVDVLICTTNATEPVVDDIEKEKQGWSKEEKALYIYTALERVKQDLRAVRAELGLDGILEVHSFRILWEQESGEKLVDDIVGFPPRVEKMIREKFDKGWEDYEKIFIDVAGGLRPLGTGLWLTVAYLMEARGLGRRTTAFYVEMVQADTPVFFPASLEDGRRKLRPRSSSTVQGRLIDLTPFFNSLSATVAVSHLARNMDFREVMRLIQSTAGTEITLPEHFEAFASAAQLGLDLEAVALARRLEPPESRENAPGREVLAEHLMGEVVDVGKSWARFHEGVNLPQFRFRKKDETFKLRKKTSWPLDAREIWREADLVQQFLDHGRLADALLHLREMVISVLQIVEQPKTSTKWNWLDHRRKDEFHLLGRLAQLHSDRVFREEFKGADGREAIELAKQVGILTDLRNPLAHIGRSSKSDDPRQLKKKSEELWEYFRPPDGDLSSTEDFQTWLEGWPTLALSLLNRQTSGFINLSNHPLKRWSARQVRAAEALCFGPLEDWAGGFPHIDPQASTEDVEKLTNELVAKIRERRPAALHVAGELVAVSMLVRKLTWAGIRCFAATSERVATEELQPDGSVKRSAEFRFVKWREYTRE